jgi:hypothetical protein
MRDLPVLSRGRGLGVLGLRVVRLLELAACVPVRAGWRLPVLPVLAGVRWAGMARGALLRTMLSGGVRDGSLLRRPG